MNKWPGLLILLWLAVLTGCSAQQSVVTSLLSRDAADTTDTDKMVSDLIDGDPGGAISAPQLPPGFAAAPAPVPGTSPLAPSGTATPESGTGSVPYTIEATADNAPELLAAFERTSLLYRLEDSPPRALTGLEQRLNVSLSTGRDILNSFGYYSGEVQGRIEGYQDSASAEPLPDSGFSGDISTNAPVSPDTAENTHEQPGALEQSAEQVSSGESRRSSGSGGFGRVLRRGGQNRQAAQTQSTPVVVRVVFTPGPQYHMGRSVVLRTTPPGADAALPGRNSQAKPQGKSNNESVSLPKSLVDVGLPEGAPAIADQVLAAVDRVRESFRNQGYPFAAISSTRYVLNCEAHTLDAEIRVAPGAFVRMGDLETVGPVNVRPSFLEELRTWEPGEPWSQEKVDAFRDRLRQTRLFQSVDVVPAEENDASGQRPVLTTLVSAPERSVGGVVKYDSHFGFGVQGHWENRNLTGRGDRLRVEMPLWSDMQELFANYRLPFFLRNDQTFIARAGVLNQKTDAYDLQSGAVSAGIERRFSERWSGSIQGSAEGGSIKDPDRPRHSYTLLGVPLGVTYNNTGRLLDARSGTRAMLSLAPYTGEYDGDFSILRSRLDLQHFFSMTHDDTLVLALRGAYGTVTGADASEIPPSVRFYSGGGGSVRGYAFQSLGPRNSNDDPLGGASLVEVGIEPRWKIAEEWGVLAFLDGGMAYEDSVPDLSKHRLRWGAGVGLSYYTIIGPIRFEVATPLNPRDDDDPLQFYISIGQSF